MRYEEGNLTSGDEDDCDSFMRTSFYPLDTGLDTGLDTIQMPIQMSSLCKKNALDGFCLFVWARRPGGRALDRVPLIGAGRRPLTA